MLICTVQDDNFDSFTSALGSVRLNKVSVWGLSSASGGSTTIALSYSGASGPDSLWTDTGNNIYPAYISKRVPRTAFARLWINGASESEFDENVFAIEVTSGDVVDIDIEFTLLDGAVSGPTQSANSDPTVGGIYYNSLNSSANSVLPPKSVQFSGN